MSKPCGLSGRFRKSLYELGQSLDRPWNWSRIHGWLAVAAALIVVGFLFVDSLFDEGGLSGVGLFCLDVTVLSLIVALISVYVILRHSDRRFRRVSEDAQRRFAALAANGSPDAISSLLGAMEYRDEEVRRVAAQALSKLLEGVSPLDGAAVTQRSRNIVHRYLQPEFVVQHEKRMADFACRLLRALPNIDDHESLRVAEKLTNLPAKSDALIEVAVAARQAVVKLNDRLKFDPHRDRLLRSAHATDGASDVLLRTASPASASTPEELLRAHVGGDDPSQ